MVETGSVYRIFVGKSGRKVVTEKTEEIEDNIYVYRMEVVLIKWRMKQAVLLG
jgi:hypothetical protein